MTGDRMRDSGGVCHLTIVSASSEDTEKPRALS